MPIYEYECGECGERFERIVWTSAGGEVAACPACEAQAERMMSAFAVGSERAGASACAEYGQTCGGKAGCAAAGGKN